MKTIPCPFPEDRNNFNILAFHTEGPKEEEKEDKNTAIRELAWTNYRHETESDTGNGYGRRKNDRRKWTGLIVHESLALF